jgi:hypothetical protein
VCFLYAGSLRGGQEVGKFFEVFGRLVDAGRNNLHLTLLGFISPQHEALARAALPPRALDVSPPVHHRGALEAMAAADVLVVFSGGGGAAGADTMTGKIYEYLALRRPILLIGPDGPAARLVVENSAGCVAHPDDVDDIERAIGGSARLSTLSTFQGAGDALLARFDRQHQVATYAMHLHAALKGQAADA